MQAAADMFNEFLVVKRAWQLHQMQTRKGVLLFSLNRTIDIKNNLLFCKNKSIKWTLLFLPFWGRLYISYFLQQLAYASSNFSLISMLDLRNLMNLHNYQDLWMCFLIYLRSHHWKQLLKCENPGLFFLIYVILFSRLLTEKSDDWIQNRQITGVRSDHSAN